MATAIYHPILAPITSGVFLRYFLFDYLMYTRLLVWFNLTRRLFFGRLFAITIFQDRQRKKAFGWDTLYR
jgi:hypothetical protein